MLHAQPLKRRASSTKPAFAGYPIIFLMFISPTAAKEEVPQATKVAFVKVAEGFSPTAAKEEVPQATKVAFLTVAEGFSPTARLGKLLLCELLAGVTNRHLARLHV